MDQIRVRTQDGGVARRPVPINNTLIAGTTSGAADTIFTVRDGILFEVKRLVVVNTSAGNVSLDLHSVPSGGSIATNNTEVSNYIVPSDSEVNFTELIGGLYEPGTTIQAWAGSTNVLVIHGWGEEIL